MSHLEHNYAGRIRSLGYRLTPQRQTILDILCATNGFATINQLYNSVQRISPATDLSTLYRTLKFFQDIHLVITTEIEGETVYDLAPPEPTHHLLCESCGHMETIADHHLDALREHLHDEHGFVAHLHHITISGLCPACQEAT